MQGNGLTANTRLDHLYERNNKQLILGNDTIAHPILDVAALTSIKQVSTYLAI